MGRTRSAFRSVITARENLLMQFNNLFVDLDSRVVSKGRNITELTTTEYTLPQYLLKKACRTADVNQAQYLRVYFGQIRRNREAYPPGRLTLLPGLVLISILSLLKSYSNAKQEYHFQKFP